MILTNKVFEENKGSYSKTKLLNEFERLFETDRIIIIPWDKKESYGRSDGMERDSSMIHLYW